MFDHRLQKRTKHLQIYIAKKILNQGFSANQLSFLGLFCAVISFVFLINQYFLWALVFILLNRLLDGLDGTLARLTKESDQGGFIDIVFDFLFYSSVPLGFAFANPEQNALAASLLIYSFVGTGCSFLAFAIIAAKRQLKSLDFPDKSFYYLGGITEAGETVFVFVLMCLFPNQFIWFAYSFAVLCLISTFLRVHAGWSQFKDL